MALLISLSLLHNHGIDLLPYHGPRELAHVGLQRVSNRVHLFVAWVEFLFSQIVSTFLSRRRRKSSISINSIDFVERPVAVVLVRGLLRYNLHIGATDVLQSQCAAC